MLIYTYFKFPAPRLIGGFLSPDTNVKNMRGGNTGNADSLLEANGYGISTWDYDKHTYTHIFNVPTMYTTTFLPTLAARKCVHTERCLHGNTYTCCYINWKRNWCSWVIYKYSTCTMCTFICFVYVYTYVHKSTYALSADQRKHIFPLCTVYTLAAAATNLVRQVYRMISVCLFVPTWKRVHIHTCVCVQTSAAVQMYIERELYMRVFVCT